MGSLLGIVIPVLAIASTIDFVRASPGPAGKAGDVALPAPPTVAARSEPAPEESRKEGKLNSLSEDRAGVKQRRLPSGNLFGTPDRDIRIPAPDVAPVPRVVVESHEPKGIPQSRPAARTTPQVVRPVTEAEMKEVWIFIENASAATGKMPRPALVYSALVKAESRAAEKVKNGSIFLTIPSGRESVWAFEWKALERGGWVASQNGVEHLTAEELKRRLGR